MKLLERWFKLSQNGTTVRTECRAGVITFLTMCYVIFVQPVVLAPAMADGFGGDKIEMYKGAVFTATCLSAALATLLMAFLANYPIGLASGMGENFFFQTAVLFGAAGMMGLTWGGALLAVFLSGLAFTLLSVCRVRELVVDAIPASLKHGIAVGIGLFIAFIGLKSAGVICDDPYQGVKLGQLASMPVLIAAIGFFATVFFLARNVRGAILWGLLIAAGAGLVLGVIPLPEEIKQKGAAGLVKAPPSLGPTFFKFDWTMLGASKIGGFIVVTLTFLFMDLFDTVGTLVGVGTSANLLDKNGKLPRMTPAFLADSIGTMFGAVCGTSTVTCYIESAAGVKAGGRTGLTAVVVAVLFLLALFFSPLVGIVGGGVAIDNPVRDAVPALKALPATDPPSAKTVLYPVTAAALIIVGSLMIQGVAKINWGELSESMPAFLTMICIPLTYSISNGLAIGFISYPVVMIFQGKAKKVHWLAYLLAAIFLAAYIFGPVAKRLLNTA